MSDTRDYMSLWDEIAAASDDANSVTIIDSPERMKQLLAPCHQLINHAIHNLGATPYELRWMAANISVRVNETTLPIGSNESR